MILRKAKTNNPYVMVDKNFILDVNLSFKAKGILLYMLSRPDNWDFYETEITEHTTDGIKSVRAGIKELIEYGYIERQQIKNSNKFAGYEYIIHETSPLCRFRKTRNRITQNGTLLIKEVLNNNITNNRIINGVFSEKNTVYSLEETLEIINYFLEKYYIHTNTEHPIYKKELWFDLISRLGIVLDSETDFECYFDMIDRYFKTDLKCDYRFAHFMSEGILTNSFYEKCY